MAELQAKTLEEYLDALVAAAGEEGQPAAPPVPPPAPDETSLAYLLGEEPVVPGPDAPVAPPPLADEYLPPTGPAGPGSFAEVASQGTLPSPDPTMLRDLLGEPLPEETVREMVRPRKQPPVPVEIRAGDVVAERSRLAEEYLDMGVPYTEAYSRAEEDIEDLKTQYGRFGEPGGSGGWMAALTTGLADKLEGALGEESALAQVSRAMAPKSTEEPIELGSTEERVRGKLARGEQISFSEVAQQRIPETTGSEEQIQEAIKESVDRGHARPIGDWESLQQSAFQAMYDRGDITAEQVDAGRRDASQRAQRAYAEVERIWGRGEPGDALLQMVTAMEEPIPERTSEMSGEEILAQVKKSQRIPMQPEIAQQNIEIIDKATANIGAYRNQQFERIRQLRKSGGLDDAGVAAQLEMVNDEVARMEEGMVRRLGGGHETVTRELLGLVLKPVEEMADIYEEPTAGKIAAFAASGVPPVVGFEAGRRLIAGGDDESFLAVSPLIGGIDLAREAVAGLGEGAGPLWGSYQQFKESAGYDPFSIYENPAIPLIIRREGALSGSIIPKYTSLAEYRKAAVGAGLGVLEAATQEVMSAFSDGRIVLEGPDKGYMMETPQATTLRAAAQLAGALVTTKFGRALARAGQTERSLLPASWEPEWMMAPGSLPPGPVGTAMEEGGWPLAAWAAVVKVGKGAMPGLHGLPAIAYQQFKNITGDADPGSVLAAGAPGPAVAALYQLAKTIEEGTDQEEREEARSIWDGITAIGSTAPALGPGFAAPYLLYKAATMGADQHLADLGKGVISDQLRRYLFFYSAINPLELLQADYWKDYANSFINNEGFWEEAQGYVRANMDPESTLARVLVGLGLFADVFTNFEGIAGMPLRWSTMDLPRGFKAANDVADMRGGLRAQAKAFQMAAIDSPTLAAWRAESSSAPDIFGRQVGDVTPTVRDVMGATYERGFFRQALETFNIHMPEPIERAVRYRAAQIGLDPDVGRRAYIDRVAGNPPDPKDLFRPDLAGKPPDRIPYDVIDVGQSTWGRRKLREAQRSAWKPEDIARELGLPKYGPGSKADPAAVWAAVVRSVVRDTNKLKFPTRVVPITTRSLVPQERLPRINQDVYKTFHAALGVTPDDLAKRAKMAAKQAGQAIGDFDQIPLTDVEQAGVKVLVNEVRRFGTDAALRFEAERRVGTGMDPDMARRMFDPDADLSTISFREWSALRESVTDAKAGPGMLRSRRAEKMPITFLENVVDALFAKVEWTPEGRIKPGIVNRWLPGLQMYTEKAFTLKHEFARFSAEFEQIMEKGKRRLGRVPTIIANRVEALHKASIAQARAQLAVGPGPIRRISGWLFNASNLHFVDPEIVTRLFGDVEAPVVLDNVSMRAFEPILRMDEASRKAAPTEGAKLLVGGKKPLVAAADMPAWLDAVEHVLTGTAAVRRELSTAETAALARARAGIATPDDLSHLVAGLDSRLEAILKRGDEIIFAMKGESKGYKFKDVNFYEALSPEKRAIMAAKTPEAKARVAEVTNWEKPVPLTLAVYKLFYGGDWDSLEAIMKERGLTLQPRNRYVIELYGLWLTDKIVQDTFAELAAHALRWTTDDALESMRARKPKEEPIVRRMNRVVDHLDALGFRPEEYNLVWKAYESSTIGLDKAMQHGQFMDLLHKADEKAAKARRDFAAGKPPDPPKRPGMKPGESDVEFALRKRAHGITTKFRDRAAADKAINKMRADLRQRGFTDAVMEGPLRPIEEPTAYQRKVGKAIDQILNNVDGTVKTVDPKTGKPTWAVSGSIRDKGAYMDALAIVDRFGLQRRHKAVDTFVPWVSPSGHTYDLPDIVVQHMAKVLEEAAPLGSRFSGVTFLEKAFQKFGLGGAADIVRGKGTPGMLLKRYCSLMKQAVTVGIFLPKTSFMTMQLMGNLFYVYQHMGMEGFGRLGKTAVQDPIFVGEMLAAMWKEEPGIAKHRVMVTENGDMWTSRHLAEAAMEHGLDSSLVNADFERALDADMTRFLATAPYVMDKLTVGGWRRSVREIGTLVDNTFRVLVFQDAVKRGMSLDAAASLARR
ncbi:MAG: hypothetical protein ABIL09_26860, partial [Gemmatimonadota bacterium]